MKFFILFFLLIPKILIAEIKDIEDFCFSLELDISSGIHHLNNWDDKKSKMAQTDYSKWNEDDIKTWSQINEFYKEALEELETYSNIYKNLCKD